MSQTPERINERCPSCGNQTLFIGSGGLLVCSWLECKNPCAAHDALQPRDPHAPETPEAEPKTLRDIVADMRLRASQRPTHEAYPLNHYAEQIEQVLAAVVLSHEPKDECISVKEAARLIHAATSEAGYWEPSDIEGYIAAVLPRERHEPPKELRAVMIGGNHLASSLIGYVGAAPWHDDLAKLRDWTYDAILERFGQPVADMWVAWKAIMDLRDSREAAAGITEPPLIVQRLRRKESPTPRSPEQPK